MKKFLLILAVVFALGVTGCTLTGVKGSIEDPTFTATPGVVK